MRLTFARARMRLYHNMPQFITEYMVRIAISKLRKMEVKKRILEHYVEIAYTFHSLSIIIKPYQVKEEIIKLTKLISEIKPKIALEIGTAGGGTLYLLSKCASSDSTIISIDLPEGMFGGGYPIWKIPFYKSFARVRQRMYLIRADSHNSDTLEICKSILAHRTVDFLFLDGDHRYKGVKKDFEMYSPLVTEGGIIAFHDIVPGPPASVGGVPRFWREIHRDYRYLEIVKNWNQGSAGIGVIYV